MAEVLSVGELIGSLLFVVLGIALVPVMYTFISAANITDAGTALVVSLIPLIFVFGIIAGMVKKLF